MLQLIREIINPAINYFFKKQIENNSLPVFKKSSFNVIFKEQLSLNHFSI